MYSVANYIFESLIGGLVFYLLFQLVISKIADYSFQRVVLLLSSLIVTVFPLIKIQVPNSLIAGYVLDPVYIIGSGGNLSNNAVNQTTSVNYFILIFFLISSVVLMVSMIHFYRIFRTKGRSVLKEKNKIFNVFANELIDSPFSFGKSIYVPLSCKERELDIIISHEKSHIIRKHTLDILLMSLIYSIQWFNPFIYIFRKNLVEIHEFQADMDVLKEGTDINKYREILFYFQFNIAPIMSNSLHKSLTHKRFIKMENLIQKKAGVKAVLLFSAAAMLLFTVTSFSKGSVSQESSDFLEVPSKSSLQTTPQDTTTKEIPFMMVEVKPKFMGGDENTFTKWVSEKIVYPEQAKKNNTQGRVIVQFIVSEKGKVGKVKVLRGVSPELDNEAVRVVSSSPDWEPGKLKGKNVIVVYTFPVVFMLSDKTKSK